MSYEPHIHRLEQQIREYGQSLEFLGWLRGEINRFYSFSLSMEKDWAKHELLSHVEYILFTISEERPADPKAFVEKELRKRAYDHEFCDLVHSVMPIEAGDLIACHELEREIEGLIRKAEKEFPGFRKAKTSLLSQFRQDMLAVKTRGALGNKELRLRVRTNPNADTREIRPLRRLSRVS